nr:NADH dehydrogenase subunit 6 [Sobrala sp. SL-2021a]
MKMMIMKTMMFMSIMTLLSNNPMTMGLYLLIQTMLTTMLINKMMMSSWFMMITFLMMVGGLLIMIMYMSSIASNEKLEMNFKLTLILVLMIMIIDEMMNENMINETNNLMYNNNMDMSLTKIYNLKSMIITILMVLYLLLTMISVSNIVKHHKGPLRSYYK